MSVGCATAGATMETLVRAAVEDRVDACGLCSCRRPCWNLWSVLPLETTLRFMNNGDVRNYMKTYDLCCC